MENEEKVQQTEESTTAEEVSKDESTIENSDKPFKIYNTEEEYNKDFKSASMKRVNEMFKELGVSSMNELKAFKQSVELLNQRNSEYDSLKNEKDELEIKASNLSEENTNLKKELLLNKFGIDGSNADDFLTLAKSKVNETKSLEDACSEVLEKYPSFRSTNIQSMFKIGSPKSSEDGERPLTADEERQLELYFGINKRR
nr:MAG TPA: Major capsid protein [Caudoviricetes sp.]